MPTPAFDRLDPGLRQKLWDLKWPTLRPLQVDAIHALMDTAGHALITAGTASGKTEAAFLPILSLIQTPPPRSVAVLYIGPTKALINDQFGRVEDLCDHLQVPVHRRHGDVSAAKKDDLTNHPAGVVLTTPESLESLFINRSGKIQALFRDLRFVVIDELHAFLGAERGVHLRSLLYRLDAVTEKPPRIVGLSATLGGPRIAAAFLDPVHPDRVVVVTGDGAESELKLRLHVYESTGRDPAEDGEDDTPAEKWSVAEDLVTYCADQANLIFANTRSDVETYADLCKRIAERKGLPSQFLVHHGSLSTDTREEAEATLKGSKKSGRPVTAFCSSTLEMGIDIGNVKMVGQLGAPRSVASLKQRLGRSGRTPGAPRILRGFLECTPALPDSSLFDRLQLPLVQTIAVTELLIAGWVEPPKPPRCDLSTLIQQVISVIAEKGAATAAGLLQMLCKGGAFADVPSNLFARLLRQLASRDVIEQTGQGDLILGLLGETIRKDRAFYSAFKTSDAFAVLHDGEKVGSVDSAPAVGEHLLLGGRRWHVTDVDDTQRAIYVKPAGGYKKPVYTGGGGSLHPRLVQSMRDVLAAKTPYLYLDKTGEVLLDSARQAAAISGILGDQLVSLESSATAALSWTGTDAHQTLVAMFESQHLTAVDETVAVRVAASMDSVIAASRRLLANPPSPLQLAPLIPDYSPRKYDYLLGELVHHSIAAEIVDLPAATAVLRRIVADR